MAIIKGAGQQVSGLVGGAVYVVSGSKTFIRSRPVKRTSPLSEAELATRLKFKTEQDYLKQFLPFIRIGFRQHAGYASAANACKSLCRQTALAGAYPEFYINGAALLLSRGTLPMPAGFAAEFREKQIICSWQPDSSESILMLAAKNRQDNTVYMNLCAGTAAGGYAVLETGAQGKYELWAAVYEARGEGVSDSLYMEIG